uniref:Major sperm protein n=1 Tax=Ascaris lumbricoides TaxID=6252 RepID=A0A0M3HVM0_ASCLU
MSDASWHRLCSTVFAAVPSPPQLYILSSSDDEGYLAQRMWNAQCRRDYILITNAGGRRIGWAIKTTNMRRLGVDPPCGVLDPKESVLMAVSCDTFNAATEDLNNDRITIEWTNTPDGAAKQFRREWFQGDGMVRRKNLPIEYNL